MNGVQRALELRGVSDSIAVGKLLIWVFGLAPALLFIVTWSQDRSDLQLLARSYALPVVWAEIMVIGVSAHCGIRFTPIRVRPLMSLGAFVVLAWSTAVTADDPATAILRTAIWTVHIMFAIALINLRCLGMLNFAEQIRAVLWGFVLFFALLIVFVATTQQSAAEPIFELPAFSNIRWFGYYSAAVVALCAFSFIRCERFGLFVATTAFAMAFWTGTRGAVLAVAVGFAAGALLFFELRDRKFWGAFLSCAAVGFVLAIGLDMVVPLGDQGPESMARYSDSGRIEVWRGTVELIRSHLWFGHGDGQFQMVLGDSLLIAQPHNIGLQILYAWGLLGGALCLALCASAVSAFLQASSPEVTAFKCCVLVLGAYSFIDGALFYNQSLSLFAMSCAAFVGGSKSMDAGRNAPGRPV